MYENRIAHLRETHRVLDKRIDEMERNGHFEDNEMQDLKKKRLFLKDEIKRLEAKQQETVDTKH